MTEGAYLCHTSYDSFFIHPLLLQTKTFCDIFLRSLVSSQELVVIVVAMFTPAPAYHQVTATKLALAFIILFYYIPSPYLLFEDGWAERLEAYSRWGLMTAWRREELEELLGRADPAFKRFEKKMRKAGIESRRRNRRE